MGIKLPAAVTSRFGRQLLHVQKASPQIMFAAGVVGAVGATVLACRATLRADMVLDRAKGERHRISHLVEENPSYTEKDHKHDQRVIKVHVARDMTKLYTPAIVVGVASVALLTGSHVVLTRRNAGLTAAYALMDKAFGEYRDRVRAELGTEQDDKFRYGTEKHQETVQTANGKKVKTVERVSGKQEPSLYARFFTEGCSPWQPRPDFNAVFLRAQQEYFNNMLRARGHVFLNEVYDALGMDRTGPGAVVGWVANSKTGDNYIDFGIFDDHKNPQVRDFVNGHETDILLDFNVDGVIYDKI